MKYAINKILTKPTKRTMKEKKIYYHKVYIPDFSDSGNNLDRNSCIRPQKTVFCDFDNLLNKSLRKIITF